MSDMTHCGVSVAGLAQGETRVLMGPISNGLAAAWVRLGDNRKLEGSVLD